jgi:NADH-quinone oxidoreductase subunit L
MGLLGAITLLLFLGATGKSAQIPLYVWLPDAMAGPTPVSALIHAATMVTAGVYMIARSSALYSRAPETMIIVAAIGVFTALVAALIAFAQTDIKKVLAYSTVSQLGYMFLAVGVGAFATGVFHLYTHAFFKALLFLGSGSVILALHHEQDMARMGGLRKYLPITWATMGIGTLAIAGIPPFAGFFSKDEILWRTFSGGQTLLWIVGVAVAAMTAFYMARLIFLTFYGKERFSLDNHGHGDHGHGHHGSSHPPKDPSGFVTVPLMILAALSLVGGLVGPPAWLWSHNYWEEFLEPVFHYTYVGEHHGAHSHALEIGLAAMVIALAVGSIYFAYRILISRPEVADGLVAKFPGVHRILTNKFYLDEIYDAAIVWPIERISRGLLWKFVDVSIIDGAVNGVASLMISWGQRLRKIQGGYARVYASWILLGAVVIVLYYFFTS